MELAPLTVPISADTDDLAAWIEEVKADAAAAHAAIEKLRRTLATQPIVRMTIGEATTVPPASYRVDL